MRRRMFSAGRPGASKRKPQCRCGENPLLISEFGVGGFARGRAVFARLRRGLEEMESFSRAETAGVHALRSRPKNAKGELSCENPPRPSELCEDPGSDPEPQPALPKLRRIRGRSPPILCNFGLPAVQAPCRLAGLSFLNGSLVAKTRADLHCAFLCERFLFR